MTTLVLCWNLGISAISTGCKVGMAAGAVMFTVGTIGAAVATDVVVEPRVSERVYFPKLVDF